MNIEIANRLVNLRKENGLSQEQLAEKIGVSRQAVSKWERSEASPDTDNIILLARLYNISLDELLRTEDEIPTDSDMPQEEETGNTEEAETTAEEETEPFPLPEESHEIAEIQPEEPVLEETQPPETENKENIQKKPLKTMVNEWWKGLNLHVGFDGIYTTDGMTGEEYRKWNSDRSKFAICAVSVIIIVFFVFAAMMPYNWTDTLALMILLPFIVCSFESAIKSRNPSRFAYPLFILEIFLFVLYCGFEKLSLLLWLTVPIYYWGCNMIKKQTLGTYFIPTVVIIIYIAAGVLADLWVYGLIIFALIPLCNVIKNSFKIK